MLCTDFSFPCQKSRKYLVAAAVLPGESLPNRYSALSLAHVSACVTGLQHSELYRFGRFALPGLFNVITYRCAAVLRSVLCCLSVCQLEYWPVAIYIHLKADTSQLHKHRAVAQ